MTRIELLERAKPILFNTEMVRAIQDGRKTVTRRIIKLKYGNTHIQWHKDKYRKCLVEMQNEVEGETYGVREDGTHWQKVLAMREIKSPYNVGDILYVRETWGKYDIDHIVNGVKYAYRADTTSASEEIRKQYGYKWHPSIHMPKEAARIFLRVTDVRVERLQDISTDDIRREGIDVERPTTVLEDRTEYAHLWNSTVKKSDLAKYGWNANPWVWVIEFERVEVTA